METARTILFADVCDSTRLMETIGDVAARAHLAQLLDTLTLLTEKRSGRVVKTIGDEIMCAFMAPRDALLAASDMQRYVSTLPSLQGVPWRVRIGLHSGPVLLENDDIFGDVVNVAARVVELAVADQVLTTVASTRDVDPVELPVRTLGTHQLRGRDGLLQLCELLWRDDPSSLTVAMPRRDDSHAPELECRLGSTVLLMTGDRTEPVSLGRGADCSVVVPSHSASRAHAKIVRRGGLFYLEDHSTNGTYVTPEGGEELFVHRDQVLLQGAGTIRLGEPMSERGPLDIAYRMIHKGQQAVG